MSNEAPISICPHCGSGEGYYTKERVTGTAQMRYKYDGSEAENESMYDCLSFKGGKVAYSLGVQQ